jgi:hypothetical protein
MIVHGLGILPQPPAQTYCRAQMTLFMRIGASQVGKWQYSFQSSMEMQLIQHYNARPHTSL